MKIGIKRFLPLSLWAIMAFQLTAQNDTLPLAHSKHPRREVTLGEVTVMANGVGRVKQSAFNTVAISTREMQNTTKNLSDAHAKAPGLRLREAGGVGSDMSLMMDGLSGKHVKIFIDGVPQEGVGASFGLNNMSDPTPQPRLAVLGGVCKARTFHPGPRPDAHGKLQPRRDNQYRHGLVQIQLPT